MDFEKDLAKIKEKLDSYKKDGYDRIHIAGGTSKDGVHYSGVIVYHFDPVSKKIFFVGLPYKSKFHINGDENGHTKKAGETPAGTAVRELIEETGLQAKNEDLDLIYDYTIADNRPGREGQNHTKYFFMIKMEDCKGELFSFEGPNPIDAETAAPILIPVRLFTEVVFKSHLAAVDKAIDKLRSVSMEYYEAL